MPADITAVLAKHRRATVHLEQLKCVIERFLREGPYRITSGFESDRTELVYRVADVRAVPEEVGLILGDVVHNARACLDHLAYALASTPNRQTAFPILTQPRRDKNSQPLKTTISGGISEPIRQAVVSVQPYQVQSSDPARHPLAVLKELDDADKHRALLPAVAASNATAFADLDRCGYRVTNFRFGTLEIGEPFARLAVTRPDPDPKPYLSPVMCVALRDTATVNYEEDVLPLLAYLLRTVEETVQVFAHFL